MYFDYPGTTENDESESVEQSELDAMLARRDELEGKLVLLKEDGDGFTVLGQFFPNESIERLREMRGERLRDITDALEETDRRIATLMTELDPWDDAEGFDDDAAQKYAA